MSALNLSRRLRALRHRRHDDDGVSLVEVMAAISILAIVLAGTASALISATASTRDSRDRSVATNLAIQRLSELQAAPFTSLVIGRTTDTVVVDGVTYTVRVDLDYEDVEGDTDTTCSASSATAGQDLDYVVADIEVSWPRAPGGPARTSSIITPGVGDLDPDLGQIAVTVLDRDAVGAGFQSVRYDAQPPASGSGTQRTTSQGCAYFVNVAPGSHDVTVRDPGFVDLEGNETSVQTTSVAASTTSPLEFIYDEAATLEVTPIRSAGAGPAVVAAGQDYTVTSTYLGTDQAKVFDGTGHPRTIDGLFPFLSGYGIYAGACPAADPESHGAPALPIVESDPDATTAVDLAMQVVRVTGTPGSAVRAYMDDRPTNGCEETLEFGTMPAGGTMDVLMPYGTWRITAGTSADVTLDQSTFGTVVAVMLP